MQVLRPANEAGLVCVIGGRGGAPVAALAVQLLGSGAVAAVLMPGKAWCRSLSRRVGGFLVTALVVVSLVVLSWSGDDSGLDSLLLDSGVILSEDSVSPGSFASYSGAIDTSISSSAQLVSASTTSSLEISADLSLPLGARACVSRSQRLYSGWLSRAGYSVVRDVGSCNVQVRTAHHVNEEIPLDRLVSSLGFRTCVSGSKSSQLLCRASLARRAGCDVDSSGMSPLQFDLGTVLGCVGFVSWLDMHDRNATLWLEKPTDVDAHGRGQVLHRDMSAWRRLGGSCTRGVPRIMVEYIANPALIGGRKFDVRTYVLVARLGPALVFYADGIGRLSDVAYSVDSVDPKAHITNLLSQQGADHKLAFARLDELLAAENAGFERGFFHGRFRARAQLISRYYVLSLLKGVDFDARRAARRWNLYGLDWVLDALGNSRLLEGNAFPLVAKHPLGAKVYEHALELAIKLHAAPEQLLDKPDQWQQLTTRANFTFKEWALIYNENEEPSPDVCGLITAIKSTEKTTTSLL